MRSRFLYLYPEPSRTRRRYALLRSRVGMATFPQFLLNVPLGLLEVFNGVILEISPPDVLDRITEIEPHVLSHFNAFDPRRVGGIVSGMADGVVVHDGIF